jgi:predicted RNase H-like HicB family nuclease
VERDLRARCLSAIRNGAKGDERHRRRVGITTWEECLAVEAMTQPRYNSPIRATCNGVLAVEPVSCYKIDMEIKLTAVFRKFPEGYAAFVEELPGANTQGATLEEARENLKEAVAMVLQANRELAEESLRGAEVVREPLALTTA